MTDNPVVLKKRIILLCMLISILNAGYMIIEFVTLDDYTSGELIDNAIVAFQIIFFLSFLYCVKKNIYKALMPFKIFLNIIILLMGALLATLIIGFIKHFISPEEEEDDMFFLKVYGALVLIGCIFLLAIYLHLRVVQYYDIVVRNKTVRETEEAPIARQTTQTKRITQNVEFTYINQTQVAKDVASTPTTENKEAPKEAPKETPANETPANETPANDTPANDTPQTDEAKDTNQTS